MNLLNLSRLFTAALVATALLAGCGSSSSGAGSGSSAAEAPSGSSGSESAADSSDAESDSSSNTDEVTVQPVGSAGPLEAVNAFMKAYASGDGQAACEQMIRLFQESAIGPGMTSCVKFLSQGGDPLGFFGTRTTEKLDYSVDFNADSTEEVRVESGGGGLIFNPAPDTEANGNYTLPAPICVGQESDYCDS